MTHALRQTPNKKKLYSVLLVQYDKGREMIESIKIDIRNVSKQCKLTLHDGNKIRFVFNTFGANLHICHGNKADCSVCCCNLHGGIEWKFGEVIFGSKVKRHFLLPQHNPMSNAVSVFCFQRNTAIMSFRFTAISKNAIHSTFSLHFLEQMANARVCNSILDVHAQGMRRFFSFLQNAAAFAFISFEMRSSRCYSKYKQTNVFGICYSFPCSQFDSNML